MNRYRPPQPVSVPNSLFHRILVALVMFLIPLTAHAAHNEGGGVNSLNTVVTTSGGDYNVGYGYDAGEYISTGNSNTALGYSAMLSISATPLTGNANTAIGYEALLNAQGAAANNTALGYAAGDSITTGSSNVYVGYNALPSAATDTNEIVIGASTTGNGSNTITLGDSSITGVYSYGTRYFEGSTSGYVALTAGVSPASQTYTLPAAYPGTSGYVLSSSTTGTMSWVASGGGGGTIPTEANTGLSTWENQGNATETDGATGMQLYTTGTWGSQSQPMAALCKTAPSTPYSILAEVGLLSTGFNWGGMAWRNSTNGKVETMDIIYQDFSSTGGGTINTGFNVVGFEGYALANTQAYNDGLWSYIAAAPVIWMKLKNDGTNMYEYFSLDGVSWLEVYSEALSGSYLGATGYNQICLMLVSTVNTSQIITLMNYQQTDP